MTGVQTCALPIWLELPATAVQWLLDLWHVIQTLDDVADGDAIERPALDRAIFAALVGMPANPFFQTYSVNLLPVMANAVLKWKASDDAEKEGNADEKSFVWRASFYDVVLAVVMLCHGPLTSMNAAKHVMALYGESFDDYRKEFQNA